jgi:light-regulated signal transduction histidine kinase (bacteriophytochrome)
LGRNFIDFLHPDDVAATMETAELGATEDVINFTNRYRCADGSYRYIEWRSRPYKEIIFASARDITERIEYENKLRTAYKEMDSFCYSVSHDLRAPLRSIQGFTQVLKDRYTGTLDGEADRWMGYINENATRMGYLIDDILRFTRLSRSEISRSLVDMKPIIHSVWEEQKKIYPTKELRLSLSDISPAYADSSMLYHVWQNLLSNAVKYSSQNEIIFVEIDEVLGEKESLYRVRDNGVGFDEQYKDKLFGVFQRLHSHEEFEGTGVGLAIVEKIVTKHGGRVDAHSKTGTGALFSFSIPRPLSNELV